MGLICGSAERLHLGYLSASQTAAGDNKSDALLLKTDFITVVNSMQGKFTGNLRVPYGTSDKQT